MPSHTTIGGIDLTLGKGGLRFKKRPSEFNYCVGREVKKILGDKDDVTRKDVRDAFTKAVEKCS